MPKAEPFSTEMTDAQAAELLRLIYQYVTVYDWSEDSIADLVADIAMSQDVTSDELDFMRREVERLLEKPVP